MDLAPFVELVLHRLPAGTVLANPGGGYSQVVRYSGGSLVYRRGSSMFYVSLEDLYDAYRAFLGRHVSSADLRDYARSIFESKSGGHSCNCTMLFMLLKAIGVVDCIHGAGVRGNPFSVTIPSV